jgi:pyruvate/2-oxoglutarate dehydrogenase complex dihydrolipoamide dehydrogenase (E3) component
MDGVDRVPLLTNSSLLALKERPEHLLVVGGSYIGLEFAQMFRRFGCKVTVMAVAPSRIPRTTITRSWPPTFSMGSKDA